MTPTEILAGLRQVQEAVAPFEPGKVMQCLTITGTPEVLLRRDQHKALCSAASHLPAIIAAVEAMTQAQEIGEDRIRQAVLDAFGSLGVAEDVKQIVASEVVSKLL